MQVSMATFTTHIYSSLFIISDDPAAFIQTHTQVNSMDMKGDHLLCIP